MSLEKIGLWAAVGEDHYERAIENSPFPMDIFMALFAGALMFPYMLFMSTIGVMGGPVDDDE